MVEQKGHVVYIDEPLEEEPLGRVCAWEPEFIYKVSQFPNKIHLRLP